MTSGMAAFMVAVGGTSLICYFLMNRVQARRTRRESASDSAHSGMGVSDSSGGGGWNLFSWSSTESSSSHHSAPSSDSGGGGGGDGGGSGGGD
jgi:hypothetical protein